jgi:hypothetical protein
MDGYSSIEQPLTIKGRPKAIKQSGEAPKIAENKIKRI